MQHKEMGSMRKPNIIALLAAMLYVLCVTGCSKTEQSGAEEVPKASAILLGDHANSMGLNLNNLVVQDTVSTAVESNGFISVICIDGEPDLLVANLYKIPERYANSDKTKLEADALIKANNMLRELETVKADDPESDVLGSLRLAVRSLADISGMEKSILVIDSGTSTAT